MDSEKILELILDIGVDMIQSGAETHRVEDSLYRLCHSYGFVKCNIWVVPTNIQATVTSHGGDCFTQIRHIRSIGTNFVLLDALNDLSRRSCANRPDSRELESQLSAALQLPPPKPWVNYLAGVLAGASFGVFFNCDVTDAVVAVLASLLITFFCRRLGKRENNPLIRNFIISFITELFIILSVHLGLGHHMGYITIGVVMLLISALGTMNGVRDLVHLDTLSGLVNITASFTGAAGIALGIALPLLLFRSWGSSEIMILNSSIILELLACTIGCIGFALWFNVKGRHVPFCGLGAFLTWGVYLLAWNFYSSAFAATLFGSAACSVYAQIMARLNKAPATIFMTVSVFPLIPGAALYYMMYGLVVRDTSLALAKGIELVLTCFGIVLGFMVVEVAGKYILRRKTWDIRSRP